MVRSSARRAIDAGLLLLAAALPAAVLVAVRLLPPVDAGSAGPSWALGGLAAMLIAVASLTALAFLVGGLRGGALPALLGAGGAAAIAGGAVGLAAGPTSMAPALLAGAVLLLAAAIADRAGIRVSGRRSRVAIAVAMLVLAEASALAAIVPAVAEMLDRVTGPLLGTAAAVSVAAALAGSGGFGAIGLAGALGATALLLDRGAGLELLIGLAALVTALLAGLRLVVDRPEPVPSDADERLPALAAHLADAVLHFDGHLQLRDWNPAARALLGLDEASAGTRLEDLLGLGVAELPFGGEPAKVAHAVGGLEIHVLRSDGGLTAIVRDAGTSSDGERLGRELRGTIEELLQARRTIELQRSELERSASIDLLTGVASRGAILDRLRLEIAQARRYQHPVAAVLLDIDGFAEMNHRLGVTAGDTLLREVALRMRLRVREADAIGRAGSDGFLAVLPHTDEGGAATFAGALRHRLAQRPLLVGGEVIGVTASIGIAVMRPGEDLDVDALLARVGEALDSARGAGGDRVALDRLHGLARLEEPPDEAAEGTR